MISDCRDNMVVKSDLTGSALNFQGPLAGFQLLPK